MKDSSVRLRDILVEIEFLEIVRQRNHFDSFKINSSDLRAASYSILVISEAARHLSDQDVSDFPDIPWLAIRAIGNKLRHEYQRVSEVIIWGIIDSQIGPLKEAVTAMLNNREK